MAKAKKYKVEVDEDAADFIRKESKKIQRQIMKKINSLAEEPHKKGREIKNSGNTFKIRSGAYRIAYKIEERRVLVLVVRVGYRKDFYKYYDR